MDIPMILNSKEDACIDLDSYIMIRTPSVKEENGRASKLKRRFPPD